MIRTKQELLDQLESARDYLNPKYSESYKCGVVSTLHWIMGTTDEPPML